MADPLVTICIPTYRGAPWLVECLESALAQTQSDLEVLVVDDASDDDTVAIATEYAGRDERVTVHRNPERLGLARNWNRAVELSRGTWIKFLFQDDVLAPDCVARMVAVGSEDVPLVVCDRKLEFEPGIPDRVRDYFLGLPKMDDIFGDDGANEDAAVDGGSARRALVEHVGVNFFGEPSAMLVHRRAFERFGSFRTGMIQLCDLEFAARVACQTGFVRVREELATFRIHGRSATASNDAGHEFRKDVLDTLILLHEYAFQPGFEPLRETARASVPPISLSALAARELQRAQRDVRNSDDAGPDGAAMKRALEEVLKAHPRLARPLWQLWHRVRKQVKP